MKKLLAILLVALMVLSLCACKKGDKDQNADNGTTQSETGTTNSENTETSSESTEESTEGTDGTDGTDETPETPDTNTNTACTHEWKAATCTEPKTCILCGTVAGEAPGHTWEAATTLHPKACSKCDAIKGSKADPTLSGGAGSISYAKNVAIDLSEEKAVLNLGNPCDSVKNMGVQVVIQDHNITEFDIAMPGYRMVEMDLLEEARNRLQAGGYEGKIVIMFYDRTTGEQTGTNAEIPVTVQVQN